MEFLIFFPDVGVFYSQMLNEVLGEVVDTSGKKLVESYMMSRVCDVYVFTVSSFAGDAVKA